jgi:carbonic anhydrase/acetyltransferase-like protein (isoleucine patch superfamily)
MIDVIVNGTGPLGRMVFHLLDSDDRYRVLAFTAPARYCSEPSMLDVPLIPRDRVNVAFPPDDVVCLSVLGGLGGWQARRDHVDAMRERGYRHVNYVHPTAVVQGPQRWGVNNIVFPFTTIGFAGVMGDDNVIREKVYLGHEHRLADHIFIGVGATVGGGCVVGEGAYIAMESTVTNDISVGAGAFIGIGSLLLKDAAPETRYYGHPAHPAPETPERP